MINLLDATTSNDNTANINTTIQKGVTAVHNIMLPMLQIFIGFLVVAAFVVLVFLLFKIANEYKKIKNGNDVDDAKRIIKQYLIGVFVCIICMVLLPILIQQLPVIWPASS